MTSYPVNLWLAYGDSFARVENAGDCLQVNFGITFRNHVTRLLRVPLVADVFIGRNLRDDVALPEYRW